MILARRRRQSSDLLDSKARMVFEFPVKYDHEEKNRLFPKFSKKQ